MTCLWAHGWQAVQLGLGPRSVWCYLAFATSASLSFTSWGLPMCSILRTLSAVCIPCCLCPAWIPQWPHIACSRHFCPTYALPLSFTPVRLRLWPESFPFFLLITFALSFTRISHNNYLKCLLRSWCLLPDTELYSYVVLLYPVHVPLQVNIVLIILLISFLITLWGQ